MVAPPGVAVAARLTVPVPQRLPGVVPVMVGLLTVTVTYALAVMPQASVTVTLYVVVAVIVPVLLAAVVGVVPASHRYVYGAVPPVGVASKVVEPERQIEGTPDVAAADNAV